MTQSKTILISTLATSLFVLAGCTTLTTTNTNAVTNTNTTNTNVVVDTNENTNVTVANENTNAEQASEVDTSDWLTYTNEEYGFSFKYPEDWVAKELQPGTIGVNPIDKPSNERDRIIVQVAQLSYDEYLENEATEWKITSRENVTIGSNAGTIEKGESANLGTDFSKYNYLQYIFPFQNGQTITFFLSDDSVQSNYVLKSLVHSYQANS